MAERDFPEGFLWGGSAAAHQVEGGNVGNDWWAWEHAPHTTAVEPSGDAIDHYHRYDADFAQLAELGHNAHRLSLEWSRIEPAPGEYSRAELDHYRRVLESAAEHGLTAFVTLHHFTVPRWFAERGGWLAPDALDRFARYCDVVADALADLMPWTCTINEPQILALFGYLLGYHPPGQRNPELWRRVTRRLIAAHAQVVDLLPRAGLCLQMPDLQPARPDDPACVAACDALQDEMIEIYFEDLPGAFVGVQYYTRMRVDPAVPGGFASAPEGVRTTQMGWELNPAGLTKAVTRAASSGLPVVVTENGIATSDDTERVDFLESHLRALLDAMRAGADVRGYLHWSAWDNFEWAEGYRPTFGLIAVDREKRYNRVLRESALALGRVIRSGGLGHLRAES